MTDADDSANLRHNLEQRFQTAERLVLEKKPISKQLLDHYGQASLFTYAEKNYVPAYAAEHVPTERKEEFLTTVQQLLNQKLGATVGSAVRDQLTKHYSVCTADHLGPVSHPSYMDTELLTAAVYQPAGYKYQIALTCTNVSMHNVSHPRGLLFYARNQANAVQLQKLSFFPRSCVGSVVYGFRPYTPEDIKRLQKQIDEKKKQGDYAADIQEKLHGLISSVYDQPAAYNQASYADQITTTNVSLWKAMHTAVGNSAAPELIYLEQEQVINQLLLNYHLDQDTLLHRMLFDPTYHSSIMKYCNNAARTFSVEQKTGTFLFWAKPKTEEYRKALWLDGNDLVTADGSYRIALTPESIRSGIMKGELMSGTLLDFMVLTFYYGVKCLGGTNQINYVADMRQAYLNIISEHPSSTDQAIIEHTTINTLCCSLYSAFLKDTQGDLLQANGLDLFLYGQTNSWQNILSTMQQLTLQQNWQMSLGEMYGDEFPESVRDADLANLTVADALKAYPIASTIHPFATL